ncbi:hypothetical protein [Desulfosarcina ovata]|uniref:Uncharacterized protein n=1 Tax=Desulfosarcina ovata subsp. ovata TaxID=2752305 RepID=A0A5K8AH75_9BACT|nr:hypothetical protein [Desulfosarcina ovata]BBO92043.1 hypothetical protein DSCOOX_52230 [Desulfosarcina ovata subsp. ovata]
MQHHHLSTRSIRRNHRLFFWSIIALATFIIGLQIGVAVEAGNQQEIESSYQRQIDRLHDQIEYLTGQPVPVVTETKYQGAELPGGFWLLGSGLVALIARKGPN